MVMVYINGVYGVDVVGVSEYWISRKANSIWAIIERRWEADTESEIFYLHGYHGLYLRVAEIWVLDVCDNEWPAKVISVT